MDNGRSHLIKKRLKQEKAKVRTFHYFSIYRASHSNLAIWPSLSHLTELDTTAAFVLPVAATRPAPHSTPLCLSRKDFDDGGGGGGGGAGEATREDPPRIQAHARRLSSARWLRRRNVRAVTHRLPQHRIRLPQHQICESARERALRHAHSAADPGRGSEPARRRTPGRRDADRLPGPRLPAAYSGLSAELTSNQPKRVRRHPGRRPACGSRRA